METGIISRIQRFSTEDGHGKIRGIGPPDPARLGELRAVFRERGLASG